jgi:hypothetical protein
MKIDVFDEEILIWGNNINFDITVRVYAYDNLSLQIGKITLKREDYCELGIKCGVQPRTCMSLCSHFKRVNLAKLTREMEDASREELE